MPEPTKNKTWNLPDYLRVNSAMYASRSSVVSTKKAVDSFCRFVGDSEIGFDRLDGNLLEEWAACLLYNGYSSATVSYYVKRLSALYSKAVREGLAAPTDSFSVLQARLNAPEAPRFDMAPDRETFHKLQRIVRSDFSANRGMQLAKDMLLFAVYSGGMTFGEITACRKDGYNGDNRHILDIVDRYSVPRNKYLFPLNHSARNSRQLAVAVRVLLQELLSSVGLRLSPGVDTTAVDLWIMAAMHCGISASDIAACVGSYARANAVTAFVTPSELDEGGISDIRARIVEALTDNPVRWYAMHFRRNVDYGMVARRLKDTGVTPVEIYYPMEEIMRKVGRRKVFESRPVISWLLFFREHAADVNRLYYEVGDLAWGYRLSRDAGSPYASISDSAVRDYQDAIGVLSPDTELLPDDAVELREGDCLVVLGGEFNGRPAVFVSKKKTSKGGEAGKVVYRVKMTGGNNVNWIVDRDPRLVRKITEAQFLELDRRFREQPGEA